jgi:hypothetical protein
MKTHMQSKPLPHLTVIGAAVSAAGGLTGRLAMAETPRPMPELPPSNVKRWTIRRKAAVLNAIANGVLSRDEACQRYQISEEELASWQQTYESHGLPGLRSTRLQQYRSRRIPE